MMTQRKYMTVWLPLLLMLPLIGGCTGLRLLEEDQQLYTGSQVHIDKADDIREPRNIEAELSRVLRPRPNSSFLFMRPRLWMYQVAGEPTGRGLRYWMRERLGEEPVLFDQVSVERNLRLIDNRLYNMGYFEHSLNYEVSRDRRSASVDYFVDLAPPYRFGRLHPSEEDGMLPERINALLDNSLIRTGDLYSLEMLRQERRRIDNALKRQGYYFFHPDLLLFRADSAAGNRHVDIYVTIKENIPPQGRRQYRIGNIYIEADYMVAPDGNRSAADTLYLGDGLYFIDSQQQFSPQAITRAIYLHSGSIYNVEDHDRTLNHLLGLGTFRFVNLRFAERQREDDYLLDIRVLLSPTRPKSLSAELRGVTKSNHFAGPGLVLGFSNLNLFKGAEALDLSMNAAYEVLVGRQRSASLREFGLDGGLTYPRFILPFGWHTGRQVLSPKTRVSAGVNFLHRTDAFSLTTLRLQFGYTWNRRRSTQYRVSPLVFNSFILGNMTEPLEDEVVGGRLLREGLFEQFILGGQYSFIYNSRLEGVHGRDWYLRWDLDLSGNLAYLIHSLSGAGTDDRGNYAVFGQPFAQFARSEVDLRYYYELTEGQLLASRLILGAGFPYANSDMLPFVKQFVIGGSNSIRAFHPRTLGPGIYDQGEEEVTTFGIHRTGDLKLEINLEYRLAITGLLKAALFVDAGNIWRLEEDEQVPGGEFRSGEFIMQIAMGAGTGLRIDPGFFVLRFDFAFPLATPSTANGRYFDTVRLFDGRWLRENIVFNLGIGYPF